MMTFPIPFGRYLLLEKIATGGMAEIFKAKLVGVEGFEKTLVIKRILPFWSERTDFVTMLVDEAKVLVHLNHPNIVQVYELGRVGTTYFIAMEYVEGYDLKKLIRRASELAKPLGQDILISIVIEALAGLHYAHERNLKGQGALHLVHRDISPQNILLGLGGEVKVTDFGIAKAVTQSHETQTGVLKGKYAYMSPEQAQGQALDHRSDLFSMGVVLWETLFSQRLFAAGNEIETLEKVRRAQVPWPEPVASQLYPGVGEVLQTALARDPQDRFSDAEEFFEALEDCLPRGRRVGQRNLAKAFAPLIGEPHGAMSLETTPSRQTQAVPDVREATVSLVEGPAAPFITEVSQQARPTETPPDPNAARGASQRWRRVLPWALLVLWLGLASILSYLTVGSFRTPDALSPPVLETVGADSTENGKTALAKPAGVLQVAGPPVPRLGSFQLAAKPSGAQIKASYGHRIERGAGALLVSGIPEGTEVTYQVNLNGYKPGGGKIKVAFPHMNVEEVIALEKKPPGYGTLKVNVTSSWGKVFVSGIGGSRDTPAIFSQVTEGAHTVRVVPANSAKPLSGRAVVRAGRATTCVGNLKKGNLSCR